MMNRRKFITTGATGGVAAVGTALGAGKIVSPKHPTPDEIEGPFYPVVAQKDKDFDFTRMVFPGQELNDKDLLLQRKSAEEQKLMIAEKVSDAPETYRYKIIIEKV